jgi:hypothetical protein
LRPAPKILSKGKKELLLQVITQVRALWCGEKRWQWAGDKHYTILTVIL